MTDNLPDIAISIRQPWVHCIFRLGKDIENRDWPTKVRGEVCIHASKGMTKEEWHDCLYTARAVAERAPFPEGTIFPAAKELARGVIVGTVKIADCVTDHPSPWFFGHYGFVLAEPKLIETPIPVKGKLGFFKWRERML